jgi:UDP-N-acetylglucosamine:LPS N-acetylglucosamine transferase
MPGLRVLIMCADIGAGHLTVARSLAAQLEGRPEIEAVGLTEDLSVLGPRFGPFMTEGFHTHMERIGWSYNLAYRGFFAPRLPRAVGQLALAAFGHRGLARTIRAFGADVVVTEYPVLSAALGQLKRLGRFPLPLISSISDPAGLYYWAHAGVDMHLLAWPEARAEVDRIAGPGKAIAVQPLVDPRFLERPSRSASRGNVARQLQIPLKGGRPLVLVSGGRVGMGDLAGAVAVSAEHAPDAAIVVLAGHNADAEARLTARFVDVPQVRVLGFSDRMPTLLTAADALVHTTGGTTALEARLIGCPLINYGSAVPHVRAHAEALGRTGLAQAALNRSELGSALERALAEGRRPPLDVSALPLAADVVIATALAARTARAGSHRTPGRAGSPPP